MFFLIAIMLGQDAYGIRDTYIWNKPTFETQAACIDFAQSPTGFYAIMDTLEQEFPNREVENIFCVSKERLEKFMQATNNGNI